VAAVVGGEFVVAKNVVVVVVETWRCGSGRARRK
jgi:hypothetical protein